MKPINTTSRLFPSELCFWGHPATICQSQAWTTEAVR